MTYNQKNLAFKIFLAPLIFLNSATLVFGMEEGEAHTPEIERETPFLVDLNRLSTPLIPRAAEPSDGVLLQQLQTIIVKLSVGTAPAVEPREGLLIANFLNRNYHTDTTIQESRLGIAEQFYLVYSNQATNQQYCNGPIDRANFNAGMIVLKNKFNELANNIFDENTIKQITSILECGYLQAKVNEAKDRLEANQDDHERIAITNASLHTVLNPDTPSEAKFVLASSLIENLNRANAILLTTQVDAQSDQLIPDVRSKIDTLFQRNKIKLQDAIDNFILETRRLVTAHTPLANLQGRTQLLTNVIAQLDGIIALNNPQQEADKLTQLVRTLDTNNRPPLNFVAFGQGLIDQATLNAENSTLKNIILNFVSSKTGIATLSVAAIAAGSVAAYYLYYSEDDAAQEEDTDSTNDYSEEAL